jgi:hypothetical protein
MLRVHGGDGPCGSASQRQNLDVFWIDGDCVKRKGPNAIEAMDIVYRYNKYIVVLLSAPLRMSLCDRLVRLNVSARNLRVAGRIR